MFRRRIVPQPGWVFLVLLALFVPVIVVHEPVFGGFVGLRAAGCGVVVGLAIAAAARWWRWDALSTIAAVLASYFLLGGVAALPETTLFGVLPTAHTLQLLVVQSAYAWMDLLTLTPPAGTYVGPAVLPWITGLVCATVSGLLTARGKMIAGTIPVALMGIVGIAWGESSSEPRPLLAIGWAASVILWWAWAAQRRRFDRGVDVRIGRGNGEHTGNTGIHQGASRNAVRAGQRVMAGILTVLVVGAGSLGYVGYVNGPTNRIVLRDLVDPPLDVQEYPTPLAAFRHYSTDLERETIATVEGLPKDARLRIGVMDVYDGTAMRISPVGVYDNGGYTKVGTEFPERNVPEGSVEATIHVTTHRLLGPWVPLTGTVSSLIFDGADARKQQNGLHVDLWADAAVTTAPQGPLSYTMETMIAPTWTDGQLSGVQATPYVGTETGVPPAVAELASTIASKEQGALARARAIERYLAEEGFFSNEGSAQSRPGHRTDRLTRMLDNAQLIGDDEQYSVLMALMLHSLGINARVVMGAYAPQESGTVEFQGEDIRSWVEVHFDGVGWAVFDPTPPRDQVPQTDVPKPRSVPRPQVLQPPEPPEEPAEMLPTMADKDADPQDDETAHLPWALIAVSGSALVLFLLPLLLILVFKARRRSRRRKAPARAAIEGSWAEVVDMAIDAGHTVQPELTRQETAWILSQTLWASHTVEEAPSAHTSSRWSIEGTALPGTVAVARAADRADFGPDEPTTEVAHATWSQVEQLSAELTGASSLWERLRYTFSIRSLREYHKRQREQRKKERLRDRTQRLDHQRRHAVTADAMGTRSRRRWSKKGKTR
ncbi:transglutaminase-like domain-containing protein [Schaalia suimastitidis]|uniref:transglutaminase-like domain-containing protein n=1 Tax=Schaalia suimastitidis TaxID=121163 RepID=UPI000423D962|nr:transglutaminase-like domain-containing protein [Schaalia suimastitidis]